MPDNALKFKLTRLAPTPSGYLHLGNALSFAITVSLAKHFEAKIMLRIDDLDQDRVRKAYVEDIFDTLNYLEIPWDQGPKNYQAYKNFYSQTHRLNFYEEVLQHLIGTHQLFACDCSRKDILEKTDEGSYPGTCITKGLNLFHDQVNWRLITDQKAIKMRSLFEPKIKTRLPEKQQNFIVRKKDLMPAYQLASLVDDIYYGVDLIVRGQDLYDSTLMQLHLAKKIQKNKFTKTVFYHHELVRDKKMQKLSKSEGAKSIQALRKAGARKEDIYQMLGEILQFNNTVHDLSTFQDAFLKKAGINPAIQN
ncbi:tRNA glutamyl-Q synthetase [Echinicola sp. CAU 1574]|uniref:tRNA glutamyl-Q synthetase n=1 Tax=Echinicola arenosa TaxID=2774144 RepID=A0ABR9AEU4_9BACT|nr:tRNA glutamyl-Q synthetase [Echinicola arenosa]